MKWIAIMFIGMAFSYSIQGAVKEYQRGNIVVESVKQGLEECPNLDSGSSHHTIWVKSCSEYTKTYYLQKVK